VQSVNPATQVYHRVETRTQTPATAARQVQSMEVWGRARKNGGAFPSVHAYWGPLPPGANGIEFTTNVPPTHPSPSMAVWVHGYHPDIALRQNGADVFAAIPVTTISKVP
jgi:hypothetical protein